MTDTHGRRSATPQSAGGRNEGLTARWARLADQASPTAPAGAVGALVNRMLVHTRPMFVPAVLPYVDSRRGGLILAGAKAVERVRSLRDADYQGPVLFDPAAYEHYAATPDAPFWVPSDQLLPPTLSELLDQQLAAGASVALTPTGYIKAGDTDALKAAARAVKALARQDVIFVVPMDVSLVDRAFVRQVTAILADADCPIGLILGRQFDPLTQAPTRIIPNLRDLAVNVRLMPMRTDFNAIDLVAHGAFAGAIGTGGSLRHTVDPATKPRSWHPSDTSPSVLFTELLSWWRGKKIANLYGGRPSAARRCDCAVCDGQRLTRFLRRSHQNEALAHAVAVWTPYVLDMLDQPTMRARAQYWRNLCVGSVREHDFISQHLRLVGKARLQPQDAIAQWARLPAWPVDAPARSS